MFNRKTNVKRGLHLNFSLIIIFVLSMMLSNFYDSTDIGLALDTTQNIEPRDNNLISTSLPPSVNYSLISNWSENHFSNVWDVEVIDDVAFIADEEAFILYNISNPAHPSLISRIRYPEDRYNKKIEVDGNLAFLGTSIYRSSDKINAIDIYNISDPYNPLKLALFLNYYIVDFYIQDNFLYVTTLNDGLMIIDLSDPTDLEIVGTWGSTDSYSHLLVSGDYLILSDIDSGLIILDISDKVSPIEIFNGFFIDKICSLFLEGNYLYLLNDEFLAIVTLYSITQPNLVSLYNIDANIHTYFNAKELVVKERMVYVLSTSGIIYIIDAFNVGNPISINALRVSLVNIQAIFLQNSKMFVAAHRAGLLIYDITNPSAEILLSENNPPSTNRIDIQEQLAIVCDAYRGFKLFNISQPENPILISRYSTGSLLLAAVLKDNLTFVTDGSKLFILNITNLESPSLLGSIAISRTSYLAIQGNFAYTGGGDDFSIIDISTPTNPFIVDTISLNLWISEIDIQDNLAVVTNSRSGFYLLNISDKNNIQLIAHITDFGENCYDVNIIGDLLFIAAEYDGLSIINISDVVNPVFIVTINSSDYDKILRVHVIEDLVYCITDDLPLVIYNISDLENVSVHGQLYPTSNTDWGSMYSNNDFDLVIVNETIYVASDQGLSLFGSDTDNDQLADFLEEEIYSTDHLNVDSDGDSMFDGFEVQYNFNPNNNSDSSLDSDGDGLSNLDEFLNCTNPLQQDTDLDGLIDFDEIIYKTDPLNIDTDHDRLYDSFEIFHLLSNPLDDDSDNDTLLDWAEFYIYKTDLNCNDTDNDLITDGYEVMNYLDPLDNTDSNGDLDLDGLTNFEEFLLGTRACNSDTDGDGYSDFEEVQEGTDPLDRNDYPSYTKTPILYPTSSSSIVPFGLFILPLFLLTFLSIIKKRRGKQ